MRKFPVHFVAILSIIGAGGFLRARVQARQAPQAPLAPLNLPYELGDFTGSDLKDFRAVAEVHDWPLESLVLREYVAPGRIPVDLYCVRQVVILTNCFRYSGWNIDYERDISLVAPGGGKARELIALSPPGQSAAADACLFYLRGAQRRAPNPLAIALRSHLGFFLSAVEDREVSVRMCTALADWKDKSQSEAAFAQLRGFAALLDPFLVKALRDPAK